MKGKNTNFKSVINKCLVILGITFSLYILTNELIRIDFNDISISYSFIALSLLSLTITYYLSGLGWHLITRLLKLDISISENIAIWLTSSLSKYIPGIIWGYVQRVNFLKGHGVSTKKITLCFIYESSYVALSGLIIGIFAIAQNRAKIEHLISSAPSWLFILAFIPLTSIFLAQRLNKKTKETIKDIKKAILNKKTILCLLYYLTIWLAYGLSFSLFINGFITLEKASDYILSTSIFSLSFSIAFILVIFPAGIGAREVILYFLLKNIIPNEEAILIATTSRLWTITAEIISGTLALMIFKIKKSSSFL